MVVLEIHGIFGMFWIFFFNFLWNWEFWTNFCLVITRWTPCCKVVSGLKKLAQALSFFCIRIKKFQKIIGKQKAQSSHASFLKLKIKNCETASFTRPLSKYYSNSSKQLAVETTIFRHPAAAHGSKLYVYNDNSVKSPSHSEGI